VTQPHVSEHLANERTYLAFLRTTVSLVSFGITINRFSLFILEQKGSAVRPPGYAGLVGAENAGILMVIAGAALMVFAAIQFVSTNRDIERNTYAPRITFAIVIAVVVLIACAGSLWLFSR
jgi:putative membrane protein